MKNYVIILGNGFTIDFINHLAKPYNVDVSNLFHYGENVPWPVDDRAGFLSYKHCPNLWNLGARPYIDVDSGLVLMEDIITCANISKDTKRENYNKIYLKAYKELAQYLNTLFIHYDNMVNIKTLYKNLKKWEWIKFLRKLNLDSSINKIHIITFNYDIWLERILEIIKAKFDIAGFTDNNYKFQLYKPHGSISFNSKITKEKDAYSIDYSFDVVDDDVDAFNIKYDNITSLGSIIALIPPAGDSNRMNFKWSKTINDKIKSSISEIKAEDELIICGVSYWHVDRTEFDHIIANIPPNISNVLMLNPNPPRALNAVLTTYFDNVINYTSCECLK
jgi:hypothetical protein